MKYLKFSLIGAAVFAGGLGSANAALTAFQTYVGNYGVSTDGWGSTTQAGVISASVPAGAIVQAAYLYTSVFSFSTAQTYGGSLDGTAVNFSTPLGLNSSSSGLQAFRSDVTSILKPRIDGGVGGVYNFNITESNRGQDGAALVVVYSLASLATSTVGILDGFALTTGSTTAINFARPLSPSAPGFFAEMRLGIGFSADGGPACRGTAQTSTVTVNGTRITNNAGCNDDSADESEANGNLITVGGFDDPFSPLLPSTGADKERYNLINYIAEGSSAIEVVTRNASNDDNIFLAVFHVSGVAGIDAPPPPPNNEVPLPGTLALLGLGLLGMRAKRFLR